LSVNSFDDRAELGRLEGLIKEAQKAIENQMISLRACTDGTVRELIIGDLTALGAEKKALEEQHELEKARRRVITEEQVIGKLAQLADGDRDDLTYRKTLIRILVNKIFLYDDKFTITFHSGDEEVTITDVLLEEIEDGLKGKTVCVSNRAVYQVELAAENRP